MSSDNEKNEYGEPGPLAELRLRPPPFPLVAFVLIASVASLVPLAAIAKARFNTSLEPRVHIWQDMGSQPRASAQQSSEVFADGRSDRPKIEGTYAREAIVNDDAFNLGYTRSADGKVTFADAFPSRITVDAKLLARGQRQFGIYCSTCHGMDGHGNGFVNTRAMEIAQTADSNGTTWVSPANLHDDMRRSRPVGHIFNTISNGIRNMGGLGHQIVPEDRWAIVAYVRALQLSDNYPAAKLPAEVRENMK
jgi:mono/diheme cytochrome c family protein